MNNSTVNFTAGSESKDLWWSLQMLIYSISVLFGLPTHPYIIYLIITGAGSGIASEFSNLNLSVCEIIICLYSLLSIIYYSLWVSSLASLTNFLSGIGVTGRPLFQCLICVERYLAVVHPVTFLKYKPLRYKVICCTAVWIICFGSCLGCMLSLNSNFGLFVLVFSVQFLVFLSIQLFCCLAVLRALKQSGPGERGREREEENNAKRRAFYIILITTVSMVVIYLPFTITGLVSKLTKQLNLPLLSGSFLLFTVSGFVHPFLYLHRTGKLCCLRSSQNQ